ncbi:hypothetical protein Tco_1254977 [Tanacetum coccineum]
MMTNLKHVGNFKHAKFKIKKFEEVQALYEKLKRSDEDFISIGSAEDKRLIKKMNEKGIDSSKDQMVKEENAPQCMPTATTGCCLVAAVALATWPQQQRLSLLRRTNRPCVSTFKDLVTKYSSRAPRGFNGRISYACYNVHRGEEETTTVVPNPLLGSTGDKERNRR